MDLLSWKKQLDINVVITMFLALLAIVWKSWNMLHGHRGRNINKFLQLHIKTWKSLGSIENCKKDPDSKKSLKPRLYMA